MTNKIFFIIFCIFLLSNYRTYSEKIRKLQNLDNCESEKLFINNSCLTEQEIKSNIYDFYDNFTTIEKDNVSIRLLSLGDINDTNYTNIQVDNCGTGNYKIYIKEIRNLNYSKIINDYRYTLFDENGTVVKLEECPNISITVYSPIKKDFNLFNGLNMNLNKSLKGIKKLMEENINITNINDEFYTNYCNYVTKDKVFSKIPFSKRRNYLYFNPKWIYDGCTLKSIDLENYLIVQDCKYIQDTEGDLNETDSLLIENSPQDEIIDDIKYNNNFYVILCYDLFSKNNNFICVIFFLFILFFLAHLGLMIVFIKIKTKYLYKLFTKYRKIAQKKKKGKSSKKESKKQHDKDKEKKKTKKQKPSNQIVNNNENPNPNEININNEQPNMDKEENNHPLDEVIIENPIIIINNNPEIQNSQENNGAQDINLNPSPPKKGQVDDASSKKSSSRNDINKDPFTNKDPLAINIDADIRKKMYPNLYKNSLYFPYLGNKEQVYQKKEEELPENEKEKLKMKVSKSRKKYLGKHDKKPNDIELIFPFEEIHLLPLNEAMYIDTRKFLKLYLKYLRYKQPIYHTFVYIDDINIKFVKISIWLFNLEMYFFFNSLFLRDDLQVKYFETNGHMYVFQCFHDVLYSCLCSLIVSDLLRIFLFFDGPFVKLKNQIKNKSYKRNLKASFTYYRERVYSYFAIVLFLSFVLIYYMVCFDLVFRKFIGLWILNVFQGFVLGNVYSFVHTFFIVLFRHVGILHDSKFLYGFSQFLYYI